MESRREMSAGHEMSVGHGAVSLEAGLAFLAGRINYEAQHAPTLKTPEFKLARMRRLLELCGHPERQIPCVHVAGSKGKGSTSSMIAAGLQSVGFSVGLYTSPHLQRLHERFRVNGEMPDDPTLARLLARVSDAALRLDAETPDQPGPTYFELVTLAGFLLFAEWAVDIAVLEVGMGGRLDSTNVCASLVSVVTSISLDHTKQLGGTTALIAGEKAGIIRPGVPVVSGVLEPSAAQVIRQRAQLQEAPLFELGRDFRAGVKFPRANSLVSLHYQTEVPALGPGEHHLELCMPGDHQALNAAVALATLGIVENRLGSQRQFGLSPREQWLRHCVPGPPGCEVHVLPPPLIEGEKISVSPPWNWSQLAQAVAQTRCPGRFEVLPGTPPVVLDVAHNPASMEALVTTWRREYPNQPGTVIFACSRDKDYATMLQTLAKTFERLVLTRFRGNPRAESPTRLASCLAPQAGLEVLTAETPEEAWRLATAMDASRRVCVTGSFFLVSELRAVIEAR